MIKIILIISGLLFTSISYAETIRCYIKFPVHSVMGSYIQELAVKNNIKVDVKEVRSLLDIDVKEAKDTLQLYKHIVVEFSGDLPSLLKGKQNLDSLTQLDYESLTCNLVK